VNVCVLCQGDGVLLTVGQWYCLNHVDDGFKATARFVARLSGRDEDEAEDAVEAWVRDA
jgi:hypothetical protein